MVDTIQILHVDDEPAFCELTREFLQREDDRFELTSEHGAKDALDRIQADRDQLDCILSDYQMPGMDGIEFLQTIQQHFPDLAVPFILLTGEGSEDVAAEALNAGASSYIQKANPDVYEYIATRIRHDIEAMRAHRDSQRFDTLVSAIDDPVYVIDESGRFTYVNDAFCKLTGYERSAILGSEPSLIKTEEAVALGNEYLGQLLSADGPESVTFEVAIQPETGEAVPCEDHMGVLPYEGDQFRGSLGVLRDISDRKRREQRLANAKERYQLLVEQNLVGIYITRGTELSYHNGRFAELFGHSTEPNVLAGDSLLSCVTAADQDRLADNIDSVMRGEIESIRQPFIGKRVDGTTINTKLFARGIELDGDPAVVGTVVDVNKDEKGYWELRRERNRLEEFTSIVSHDLRTPLAVAQGQLELATADDSEAPAAASLAEVENALTRMEELLEDVLELAKQGKVVADREPVDLHSLATATWENVATDDATVVVSTEKTIEADASRLKSLFENLYQNAMTHAGPDVTVTVGDTADGFYIEDNGPGIEPDGQMAVFEPGYSTAESGTGFGLSIVKQIVEAHGWEIRVTDGSAGGARFEIGSVKSIG